jgi:tRNA-splicing ligase RtcB
MSEVPTTRIRGEHTDAIVFLPEEKIEEDCYNQIQEMVNHPAFQNKVRIMPDCHWGAGAVIGFTMPLNNRVCPNTIGVDEGCGMLSVKLDNLDFDITNEEDLLKIDELVRDAIPMGRNVHNDGAYHVKNDFPWNTFAAKWKNFATNHLDDTIELGEYHPNKFEPDIEYFENLCRKVNYDRNRAISSVGTLGGGNHFIEFGTDSNNNVWITIHSGSRGLGKAITEHHQNRATQLRTAEKSRKTLQNLPDDHLKYIKFNPDSINDNELLTWLHGGKG